MPHLIITRRARAGMKRCQDYLRDRVPPNESIPASRENFYNILAWIKASKKKFFGFTPVFQFC